MNRVAHIMEEVEPEFYPSSEEFVKTLRAALKKLGYCVRTHGVEHCTPDLVEFYRTQSNKRYPFRAAYSDNILLRLRGLVGDIVVATESWHLDCFKGLDNGGEWKGLRLVAFEGRKGMKAPEVARALAEMDGCQKRFASKIPSARGTTSS